MIKELLLIAVLATNISQTDIKKAYQRPGKMTRPEQILAEWSKAPTMTTEEARDEAQRMPVQESNGHITKHMGAEQRHHYFEGKFFAAFQRHWKEYIPPEYVEQFDWSFHMGRVVPPYTEYIFYIEMLQQAEKEIRTLIDAPFDMDVQKKEVERRRYLAYIMNLCVNEINVMPEMGILYSA